MNIKVSLPRWDWVYRIVEWLHPGLEKRATTFGKASASRRFLHGVVEITAEAEMSDE